MHKRLLTASLAILTLIALTPTVARSDWHQHHRRNSGFSGQIYIQGNDRTVIRERTTVFGPGGDRPTVILRESEIVQPGSFGGTVVYGADRYSQPYDYRYDPFYRRTVERYPIGSSGFEIPSIIPVYQAPVYQGPIFPNRTIFQSCTIQIDGTSNCP
jgi:hypothetical protein